MLGRGEAHDLDLVELVLTDQAAHVSTVRAGFAAKAGRVRRVTERQLRGVQDLVGVQVRDRDLGGRNQVQRARVVRIAALGLEQIFFELRQLARAAQRFGFDQVRRIHLGVAVLARVQIEHERRERSLEARAQPQSTEKRAPESLAARSKSKMPSFSPSSQCGLGSKAKLGGSPHCRTTTFLSSVCPSGTDSCGTLGMPSRISSICDSAADSSISSPLTRSDERLELVPAFGHALLVAALGELGHGVTGRIALGLQELGLARQLAARRDQTDHAVERLGVLGAAASELSANLIEMISDVACIEHEGSFCRGIGSALLA